MLNSFKEKKFTKPSAIQSQTWPICLKGKDLIGLAETGSGKTLGFLLPGIVHLLDQREIKYGEGPIVLVLAPTRELAIQIEEECNKFVSKSKIKTCCLYGGAPKHEQKYALKRNPEIVIATPGIIKN
jgi:ATP-dependent RNA helicase DDX5/DBP2